MENMEPIRKSLAKGSWNWRRLCLCVILYNLITTLGLVLSMYLHDDDISLLILLCPMLPLYLLLGIFGVSDTGVLLLTLPLVVLPLAGWLLFRLKKAWGACFVQVCGYALLVIACMLLPLCFVLLAAIGAVFLLQWGILFFVSIFMLVSMRKWSDAASRKSGCFPSDRF